jgi:hypothetical protein
MRSVGPLIVAFLVAACGSSPSPSSSPPDVASPSAAATASAPTESAAVSPAPSARELAASSEPLPAGAYTRAAFRPRVTLELDAGWFAGTLADDFFDIQQDQGTPDVVAVQFARVERVVGAGGSVTSPKTVADAVKTIRANPGLAVIDESGSRLGGLEGLTVVIENQGKTASGIFDISPGRLSIDPQRRLWISLFDTNDGLLAVMVGGSVAKWDHALGIAEPILESVVVGPG